ncbi:carboxylating nicotinate-nucleotide diphosphorylase [Dactylosporangium fulvum]|uniref:nicotinate-nucleotide diphosphorylase (carboxylating) n=1 Tax=Dactylosporangium fulvum TaxID=53359 RepID=A0ABY5W5W8_9ACTN|nr:carboxylating nicotinate-nucleotide diphosphorylase [Dactylosporangium fulvum]UWP85398.1 carboxylating nicotinate-nucleotide diphosphorylase [Dactylosporangium fulvum]
MITEAWSPESDERLRAAGIDAEDARRVVLTALEEDLRYGADATTDATVSAGAIGEAVVGARRPGTLAGLPIALAVLDLVTRGRYEVSECRADGEQLGTGDVVLHVTATARELLVAERTMLNLLCHLSGIATVTARWNEALKGTDCKVRDTRKTLPGMRRLQKYAVRCGGGENHRHGLGDAVLVKDNHVVAAGSVGAALQAVRAHAGGLPCEVEVTTLEQLDEVLALGADEVLLDNFTVDQCAEAVRRRNAAGARTRLEASGGLTLGVAAAYARTGVDLLAVGALTHSAPALDLGLDFTSYTDGSGGRDASS